MKTVIAILIFISLVLNDVTQAQDNRGFFNTPVVNNNREGFGASIGVLYGIVYDKRKGIDFYEGGFSSTQTYSFGKGRFTMGTKEMTMIQDTSVQPYIGALASIRLFDNGATAFSINAQSLLGTQGKRLYGGGAELHIRDNDVDPQYDTVVILTLDAYQEYLSKQFRLSVGLILPIISP